MPHHRVPHRWSLIPDKLVPLYQIHSTQSEPWYLFPYLLMLQMDDLNVLSMATNAFLLYLEKMVLKSLRVRNGFSSVGYGEILWLQLKWLKQQCTRCQVIGTNPSIRVTELFCFVWKSFMLNFIKIATSFWYTWNSRQVAACLIRSMFSILLYEFECHKTAVNQRKSPTINFLHEFYCFFFLKVSQNSMQS